MSAILGVGHVSACGVGLEALRAAVQGHAVPICETHKIQTPSGEVVLKTFVARPDGLDQLVPARKLRRLDRFAQMALHASALALHEAGDAVKESRMGLVFATGHGPLGSTFAFQDGIIDGGDAEASPVAFTNSVHNMPASQVSILLGIAGPNLTLTAPELSPALALACAHRWLERGDVDHVLVGFGDELTPMSLYAVACMSSPETDVANCHYQPGEGFIALVLGKSGAAAAPYGQIRAVRFFDSPEEAKPFLAGHRMVLSAANGDGRTAGHYRRILDTLPHPSELANRYGSWATGQGFDVAAAAMLIHEDAKSEPQPQGASVACVQCDTDGATAVIELTR